MKKTLAFILAFATILSLLVLPVSAEETISDLTKVHTLLQQNLYTPFYQESEYYDDYQRVMDEIAELLEADDITQEEISRYYAEIREIYSKLIRSCHDYTSLENLLKAYESLDSSIFTEESWKLLLSVRDKVNKELTSPQIFAKSTSESDETYAKYYEIHARSFTTSFRSAFHQLEFVPTPAEMTPEYLLGYAKLVRFCAREELLGEASSWPTLQALLAKAEEDALNYVPEDKEEEDEEETEANASPLNQVFEDLTKAYFTVCNQVYDYSAAKDALTKYEILNSKSFSANSWERYAEQAKKLELFLTKTHFFFIPYGADEETCKAYAEDFLNSIPSSLIDEQKKLIPLETESKLKNLCDRFENKTTMNGLDAELKRLKSDVQKGRQVLANPDATLSEVEAAIDAIETSNSNLILAEGHLIQEQNSVVKQDAKSARFTIIFYIGSVVLALCLAIFLSRIYYGKVNWSK